jgi:peptidoglycan hydrolase CwlO-like protein
MFGRVKFMIVMGVAGIVFGVLAMSFIILNDLYGSDLESSDPQSMIVQLDSKVSQLQKQVSQLEKQLAELSLDVGRLEQSDRDLWEALREQLRPRLKPLSQGGR